MQLSSEWTEDELRFLAYLVHRWSLEMTEDEQEGAIEISVRQKLREELDARKG